MRKYFTKHIALPQDHGSWVFIFSPLLIGIFAGKSFTYGTINLVVAAMAAFMLRQPTSMIVKMYAGRRSREVLPAARFWIGVYGLIALLALTELMLEGFDSILYLAVPGIPVFAWHLWLVSKRAERRQAGIEIIATGVLSLAAPAALWVGLGRYESSGWWLWLLTWLQSAASIVHAYMRLEQREQTPGVARSAAGKTEKRAVAYTSFNLMLTLALGFTQLLPRFIFIPFLVQWLETIWGVTHPAVGWKPTRVGIRQLIVSTIWTILFIITYVSF
jgi:hypothetical protein